MGGGHARLEHRTTHGTQWVATVVENGDRQAGILGELRAIDTLCIADAPRMFDLDDDSIQRDTVITLEALGVTPEDRLSLLNIQVSEKCNRRLSCAERDTTARGTHEATNGIFTVLHLQADSVRAIWCEEVEAIAELLCQGE